MVLSRRRRLLALALVLLVGVLVGCGPAPVSAPSARKPLVLATFTVLADMARNVGGDHVRVESLTKVGAEIHGYEPTPSDVRRATEADLILANGLNLETWLDQFLQDAQAPSVTVTEGIRPLTISQGVDYPNPHAWMSPLTATVYVDNIARALSELDPGHAADFAARAETYKQELLEVHGELRESLAGLPQKQRLLVTCEGAFSYLAADAQLDEAYLWAVNSDGETGARRMMELADRVQASGVPAVFCESTVPPRAMEQIATDTGARYGGALYVDSLSEADGPVPTYLELIRYNTRLITTAFTGEG